MAEDKEGSKAPPKTKRAESKPDDPNALVAQFQILQQQLQSVLMQKETMSINKMEIDRALEELEKTSEKTAYKITGNVMVSKPVSELKKDLKNTKEAVDIRMKGLEKTEKRLMQQLKDIQVKLQKFIK